MIGVQQLKQHIGHIMLMYPSLNENAHTPPSKCAAHTHNITCVSLEFFTNTWIVLKLLLRFESPTKIIMKS